MEIFVTEPGLAPDAALRLGMRALLSLTTEERSCAVGLASRDALGHLAGLLGHSQLMALKTRHVISVKGTLLHLVTPTLRRQTFVRGPGIFPFATLTAFRKWVRDPRLTSAIWVPNLDELVPKFLQEFPGSRLISDVARR